MLEKIDDLYSYFAKREKIFGMNFGLERMHELLKQLQVRHSELKFVHLAGTNGKGSTLHFLKKILSHQGYRVGSFTSPHIETVQERIMINDEYISEADFLRLFNQVMTHIETMEKKEIYPTQFEILTVISLMYFQEKKPDIILMETGLGGRLDSTNVILPLISVITNISRDHTNILGDSIQEIANEKAGIIKADSIVVTAVNGQDAIGVIRQKANEMKSKLFELRKHFTVIPKYSTSEGECFDYAFLHHSFEELLISMMGKHQIENASLAITTALLLRENYQFSISEKNIRSGLIEASWKGRLEKLSNDPHIIVDGSHNEEGTQALVDTLKSRYSDKKLIFVMAALADKDLSAMMKNIENIAEHIILTQFTMDRALEAEQLAQYCTHTEYTIEKNWKDALEQGLSMVNQDSILVVTGSLYFLYYTRSYLKESVKG